MDFSSRTRIDSLSEMPGRRANTARVGTMVSARMVPTIKAKVRVSAMGRKILPSTRCMVNKGMKAVSRMSLENMMGLPISAIE